MDDVADIQAVVDYLTAPPYNYTITLVAGHSRGGIAGFKWVCTSPHGKEVKHFVNLSSRYRMEVSHPFLALLYRHLTSARENREFTVSPTSHVSA